MKYMCHRELLRHVAAVHIPACDPPAVTPYEPARLLRLPHAARLHTHILVTNCLH